jgi:hypothetical protein
MKISFGPVVIVPYNLDLVFKAFAVLFTLLAACGRLNEKFIITVFFIICAIEIYFSQSCSINSVLMVMLFLDYQVLHII